MAVYGKNLGKTKTDNSKNGFCIHNGGIILNIYIKVAFFCCPTNSRTSAVAFKRIFILFMLSMPISPFEQFPNFFQRLSLLLVLFYAVLAICQHVRFSPVLSHFCEKRNVFVLFFSYLLSLFLYHEPKYENIVKSFSYFFLQLSPFLQKFCQIFFSPSPFFFFFPYATLTTDQNCSQKGLETMVKNNFRQYL